jgi:PAS domain S-box-containing protein
VTELPISEEEPHSLGEVLITGELARRPSRPPDMVAENRALLELTDELADNPGGVLQRIAELAMQLCRAESAGVSIMEPGGMHGLFRWKAVAGRFAANLNGTMPREASPCGIAITRNHPLLFLQPQRFFADLRAADPPIEEALLVPWIVDGKPAATLWALQHRPGSRFDSEDLRLLESLSRLAAASWSLVERTRATEQLRSQRTAALNLMEDAIAAREEAERTTVALQESEQRFRRLSESGIVGVAFFELEGAIVHANDAFLEMLGVTRGDLARGALRWDQFTPAGWTDRDKLVVEELRQTGRFQPLEREFQRADGSRGWGIFAGALLGQGQSGVAMAVDVTERRRAEDAVRLRDERLRTLADAVPQIIWANDGAGFANYFNRRWYEFTALSFEQSAGPGWQAVVHPEDAPRSKDAWQRAQQNAEVFDCEYRLRGADGSYRWFIGRNVPEQDAKGRVTGWFGTATDIHDLKEAQEARRTAEERVRLIVENARDYAIFATDLQRRITTWNSGAQAILGYTEAEALGQSADIIFIPEDRAEGAPEREAAVALDRGRAIDERWHIRKDGTRFWGSGVMMAMHDGSGRAIGMVKIFRDQTEELRTKERVEQSRHDLWDALQQTEQARAEAEAARAQAEAAGKAKDHFLAVLSHELRTPLTPIAMAAQALGRRKDLPAPVLEALGMIRRNIHLEVRLVDDLLDVTRIEHGKMGLQQGPIEMHQVIRRAVETTEADLEAKNQRLGVALDATTDGLEGDAGRMQQVIWNLLRNASKFTPEGGEIFIRTRNEPGLLLVEVADTGIGIEPEALPLIFESFAQANTSIMRRFGGLGLGLAIARAIVAAHGGELQVTSEGLGQGATFILSLPLTRPEMEVGSG